MANARINLKTIDYYKFRKLVIDGNRDEYASCSKEVRTLCDNVQTFNCRDDEFDEDADRGRFDEICCYYRQVLNGKRINPIDMRIKSGWWGDQKGSAYAIGKIKPAVLKELLIAKTSEWAKRNGYTDKQIVTLSKKIEGPGIYVFKHRERQCFQFVGRSTKIFATCAEKLKFAYEGKSHEPLAALFLITLATDWEFYFQPVLVNDDERLLRILENDIILRHDSIWPHGLNFKLEIESLLEVSEFRKSCIRYNWPPVGEEIDEKINVTKLREQVADLKEKEKHEMETLPVTATSSASSSRRSSVTEVDDAAFQALPPSPTQPFPPGDTHADVTDRPPSPLSVISTATYTVDSLERKSEKKVTPQRVMPKMGLRKGKENVQRKARVNSQNATPQKSMSPKSQRKSGLMDYPIDESFAKDPESEEHCEGELDQSVDHDTSEAKDESAKIDRPTALPIRSPRAAASPRKSRLVKRN